MLPQQFRSIMLVLLFCSIAVLLCYIFLHSNTRHLTSSKLHLLHQKFQNIESNAHSKINMETAATDISNKTQTTADQSDSLSKNKLVESSQNQCTEFPDGLIGPLLVTFEAPTFEEIAKANPKLMPGGLFKPHNCRARSRVAIIVPYRNRELQLRAFLYHMHPILQRQKLEYGIFIIEQSGDDKFNRALLMNIGYNESALDVDLFLENDRAPYGCSNSPRHMSGYIDKFEYKLPYPGIFGGISNIPKRHFEMVNGYSNMYFGWGGEDDDMYKRLTHKKFDIERFNGKVMRYKMWKHDHERSNSANERRFWLLKNTVDRMNIDGLSNLVYHRQDRKLLPTHTMVTVAFNEKEITKAVFS